MFDVRNNPVLLYYGIIASMQLINEMNSDNALKYGLIFVYKRERKRGREIECTK